MDEETLWVLKMLSAREVSARSADRILRALELLRKSEESEAESSSAVAAAPVIEEQEVMAGTPQDVGSPTARKKKESEEQQSITTEEDLSPVEKAGLVSDETNTAIQEEVEAVTEETQDVIAEVDEDFAEKIVAETVKEQDVADEEEKLLLDTDAVQELRETVDEVEETISDVGSPTARKKKEAEAESDIEIQVDVPDVAPAVEEIITTELDDVGSPTARKKEAEQKRIDWDEDGSSIEIKDWLRDDGIGIIENISDGVELILEKPAGNVAIQGWDQPYIKAEGVGRASTALQTERCLKIIETQDDITLQIPPDVGKIRIASGSGSVDIEKYTNDVTIDCNTGNLNVREARGDIKAISIEGSITIEDCSGMVALESESGNITVRKAAAAQFRNVDGTMDLEKGMSRLLKSKSDDAPEIAGIDIKTGSGNVTLADIGGNIGVKCSGGDITIERCRGQRIYVKSNGGKMELKDVANNMNLKGANGDITVENFSGEIRVNAMDAEVCLRNSGDAEIYIESDGGNISIEDCYADAYVDSGTGDVRISGGNLAFGGMGEVDLKMKVGNAYLHRRTFEDVHIAIGNGNVELNMEKLSSGGSGRISVDSGDITMKVSPSFRCEVSAYASRKNIYMELPMKIIEKNDDKLRGTLNGGGAMIELITPDGVTRLQAL